MGIINGVLGFAKRNKGKLLIGLATGLGLVIGYKALTKATDEEQEVFDQQTEEEVSEESEEIEQTND